MLRASFYTVFLISFWCADLYGQSEWKKFLPLDGKFQILFPAQPEIRSRDLNTELGMLKSYNYSVKTDKDHPNFLYSVNVVEYPENTFHQDSLLLIDDVLYETILNLSEKLKCKITYENEIMINSESRSKIFRLTDDLSGQVVKGIVVLKDNVLYTVNVFTMKEKSLNQFMDKFINSFNFGT